MVFEDEIKIKTKGDDDIINITDNVNDIVKKSKIKDGIALIFAVGSTCGITTIEYEPNLIKDFQEFLERIAPRDKNYHHDNTWGDANGFSHLRASLIGQSFCCSVKNGDLILGQWQQIVLCDFDNRPRERKIIIKIMGL
jgi:secondary thiamine-phosphate synthase enzyme